MVKNLLISLMKILGFVIVAFIIIMLFDQFNLASNESGILNSFSKFGWIDLYQDPIFNGLFTLIIVLSVVMVIVTLVKELRPKR